MKKILLIAYFFPPLPSIGAQRPYRLAKYLPEFGWEPIVLTARLPDKPPEGLRVIETDYTDVTARLKTKIGLKSKKGLMEQTGISVSKNFEYSSWKSKLLKLTKEVINYPDPQKGWYDFAVKSASELLSREKIDVIVSTSPPATSHLIASELKKRFRIPWVADFRDLWTQHHFYEKYGVIKNFETRLELKTLSGADAIVTVTSRFAEKLDQLHKNKNIYLITNGYDTDEFSEKRRELRSKFTITYTGSLYNGKRDPSLLFRALSQLVNEHKINKDVIEVRFYGPQEDWIVEDINKYNLGEVAGFYGFIPRETALKKQSESQLLLLLLDVNNNEKDVYPAKVFEYFGARRPIIAIGKKGNIIRNLLESTNAGRFTSDTDMLKNIIMEYYEEFLKNGEIRYKGNINIDNYTYYSITKRYSEVLDGMAIT